MASNTKKIDEKQATKTGGGNPVKLVFYDNTPRLRSSRSTSTADNIILDTNDIKNIAASPSKVKRGRDFLAAVAKEVQGKWWKIKFFKEFDNYNLVQQRIAGKQASQYYNDASILDQREGWIYAQSLESFNNNQRKRKNNNENKPKQVEAAFEPALYRSVKESAERRLETAKIPINTFLPPDSIGYGYSLLFNFIAGNPYHQDMYVKRKKPEGYGALFRNNIKDLLKSGAGIEVDSNKFNINILDKIGPERLQTKILQYQESSLGLKGYVHLPLNTVMKSTSELQYGAKAMGLFEDFMTSYIRGGAEGTVMNIIAELGFQVGNDSSMGQIQMAANQFFGSDIDLVAPFAREEFRAGTSTNPRTYEQYTGTAPRAFEFKYTFHPESIKQAKDILFAINKLKYHSFARRGVSSPVRMMNPDRVVVRLFWGMLDNAEKPPSGTGLATSHLFVVKPCVITKVDVGYGSAEEIGTYFDGGIPAEISLTLGLKEQENTYADDLVDEKIVQEMAGLTDYETEDNLREESRGDEIQYERR